MCLGLKPQHPPTAQPRLRERAETKPLSRDLCVWHGVANSRSSRAGAGDDACGVSSRPPHPAPRRRLLIYSRQKTERQLPGSPNPLLVTFRRMENAAARSVRPLSRPRPRIYAGRRCALVLLLIRIVAGESSDVGKGDARTRCGR